MLAMDLDGFWELIERSGRVAETKDARLAWVVAELSRRSVEEVVDYCCLWEGVQGRGCTIDLYAAHWFVFGSGSLDGFEYFVSWLVSLRRETFEKVTDCPDLLIDVPQVLRFLTLRTAYYGSVGPWSADMQRRLEEEWPEFESIAFVAHKAYEKFGHLSDPARRPGELSPVEAVLRSPIGVGFLTAPDLPGPGEIPDRAAFRDHAPQERDQIGGRTVQEFGQFVLGDGEGECGAGTRGGPALFEGATDASGDERRTDRDSPCSLPVVRPGTGE
ncbi:DUF4240 domain-containing protein [Nonomuraea sp. NPDC052265]|uniref:DUF4240 domain-containing protein n=1 Tax=Nonomuraea sp. NPDC052265 TaxID=3364374 RepID=UPI0037C75396